MYFQRYSEMTPTSMYFQRWVNTVYRVYFQRNFPEYLIGIEVRGWIPYYGTKDNHLLIPAGPAKEHQNGKSIITWRNRAMKPQTEIPTEPSTWKEHIHRQQGYIREILMESDINFFTTLQLLQNTSRTIIT